MARPVRIEFEGALYHVASRGNERRPIFLDDYDCQRRLDWLGRTVEIHGWRVHAYALMPNHDHFFIETPRPDLGAGMQFLNGCYTSYFNARHKRVGHLFQGRYKAVLVETERHFGEVSRYLHLNPVRAGLAEQPADYPWTSYVAYMNPHARAPWLDCARVLGEFGVGDVAREAYRQFMTEGVNRPPGSPWARSWRGLVLGSPAFVAKIRDRFAGASDSPEQPDLRAFRPRPSLDQIADCTARHYGEDRALWAVGRRSNNVARDIVAYLARKRYGYRAAEIAAFLGYRRSSAIAHTIARAQVVTCEGEIGAISRLLDAGRGEYGNRGVRP